MPVTPLSRVHSFEQDWYRETAVVVGNGPSMLSFPVQELDRPRLRVLVANGGYKLIPWADVLMCTDRRWLAAHQEELPDYTGPMIIVTQPEVVSPAHLDRRMKLLRRAFIGDARKDPFARRDTLVEGHNSTTTMISCAIVRGARRIILLGVDLAPGPDGRRHIYDDSKDTSRALARYQKQVVHLSAQAKWVQRKGVEVINCSPLSALQCYPYGRWEDLQWPA